VNTKIDVLVGRPETPRFVMLTLGQNVTVVMAFLKGGFSVSSPVYRNYLNADKGAVEAAPGRIHDPAGRPGHPGGRPLMTPPGILRSIGEFRKPAGRHPQDGTRRGDCTSISWMGICPEYADRPPVLRAIRSCTSSISMSI
jgi:hypothetical protein